MGTDLRTLVLSSGYEPLTIVSWKHSIIKLLNGKGEVLHTHDLIVHKSMAGVLKAPSVFRLYGKHNNTRYLVPRYSRSNVLLRDMNTCQYCGYVGTRKDLTFDHVIPRCKGGKTTWENIVTACRHCNSLKADKNLSESGLVLKKMPRKPNTLSVTFQIKQMDAIPEEWKFYVGGN